MAMHHAARVRAVVRVDRALQARVAPVVPAAPAARAEAAARPSPVGAGPGMDFGRVVVAEQPTSKEAASTRRTSQEATKA